MESTTKAWRFLGAPSTVVSGDELTRLVTLSEQEVLNMKCSVRNCKRCYCNKMLGANFVGHKHSRTDVPATLGTPEEFVDALPNHIPIGVLRNPKQKEASPPAAPAPDTTAVTSQQPAERGTDVFRWRWPFIKGYLIDGPARGEQCTILFFRDDGRWKCCLHDKARSRSAWASGDTWDECLTALDQRIGSETVEWRRSWENRK